jgi:hypothetical protein
MFLQQIFFVSRDEALPRGSLVMALAIKKNETLRRRQTTKMTLSLPDPAHGD